MNPVASIMRAASRGSGPLNILCMPTHERYETLLARTGHQFWAVRNHQVKDWDTTFAPVPENYVLLDPTRGQHQLPPDVDFDMVLSQNKFGQYQIARRLSQLLHIPLLSLEHTLPHPSWPEEQIEAMWKMQGHVNVFISEFSMARWHFSELAAEVIHHGVDAEVFKPADLLVDRKRHVLSVVNDFKNRSWCCGYDFWEAATAGLPRLHIGKSPDGWSQPARSVPDLVRHYREAAVFVDTASFSPIPTVVLEAMATGCVVVSRGNAMVPEVIEDGVNGFIRTEPGPMRALLADILTNPVRYEGVRARARKTILDRFSEEKFVRAWDSVLRATADIVYTGDAF